ncbi:MAG: pyridoxal-phosphate dependent enzyme [Myxococcales bacterium]|nr:pyridoxal-phosphate dependent enzyme [Myxococcales bacterium]
MPISDLSQPTPLSALAVPAAAARDIRVLLKRDDLLAPQPLGSKLRKLAPLIAEMRRHGACGLQTYGGPFSNHLHAVAALGHAMGFATHGIVRGEQLRDTPTLADCRAWGMTLTPMAKRDFDRVVATVAAHDHANPVDGARPWYNVAPGAAHPLGVTSCAQLGHEIATQVAAAYPETQHLLVVVPAGYGTTAAGVIAGLAQAKRTATVWVVPAGAGPMHASLADIAAKIPQPPGFITHAIKRSRFARFADADPALLALAAQFERDHGIALDPIYTVKMMDVIDAALQRGDLARGTTVVGIHTGGLQGWRGFVRPAATP